MEYLRVWIALTLALAAGIAAEKRPVTPQDLWAIKRVGSPALSPDGKRVALTVQEWSVEKNKSTTNLWLVDVAGGVPPRPFHFRLGDDERWKFHDGLDW